MKYYQNFLIILLTSHVFLFTSCSQQTDPELIADYSEYLPIQLGSEQTFDVVEILFTNFDGYDTLYYELKEVVADTFYDLSGQMRYRIELFKRTHAGAAWQIDSVWTCLKTPTMIRRRENNTEFVKMVFPFGENKRWDGHAYNNLGAQNFRMNQIGKTFVSPANPALGDIAPLSFPNTVTITHIVDTTNIINRHFRREVFQQNVGLVFKQYEDYLYVNYPDQPGFGNFVIIGGRFVRWIRNDLD